MKTRVERIFGSRQAPRKSHERTTTKRLRPYPRSHPSSFESLSEELGRQRATGEVLAMKFMAARLGGTTGEPSDIPDILFLIRHLRLPSAGEVLDLVGQYYPASRIPVKTQHLVEGLFEEGKV